MPDAFQNKLYYGDNLKILRDCIKNDTIDLIYLDPPFNSKATYNVLFKEKNGSDSEAQIKAFDDTWHWDTKAALSFHNVVSMGGKPADALLGFEKLHGSNDLLAYLSNMAERLIELHRVLKPTGTIYLHCDPTASHYLKILMDSIFGAKNFRNEIIWAYRGGGSPKTDFGRRHDVIFRYSKTDEYTFNADSVRIPYQAEGIGRTDDAMWGKHKGTDKIYKPNPLGKIPEDWWLINPLNQNDPERLGYPTQKPKELLRRIVLASSSEGEIVLDPFCGCGTTISVAQELNRKWIGIDVTHLAISLMQYRLKHEFPNIDNYKTDGLPETLTEARDLANEDKYHFQWWALGKVGAIGTDRKKGADQGIDGRLNFHSDGTLKGKIETIIFSVKGGQVLPSQVRDLVGVVNREKAALGVFITLEPPTKQMKEEAAKAGFYQSQELGAKKYQRIQILTIEEILNDKKIDCPQFALNEGNVTIKRASRVIATKKKAKHANLDQF